MFQYPEAVLTVLGSLSNGRAVGNMRDSLKDEGITVIS